MITRVRFEAIGEHEQAVKDELLEAAVSIKTRLAHGGWEEELPMAVVGAKVGFWGHYTIRRVGHGSE